VASPALPLRRAELAGCALFVVDIGRERVTVVDSAAACRRLRGL